MKVKLLDRTFILIVTIILVKWILLNPFRAKFDLFGPNYSAYIIDILSTVLLVIGICKIDSVKFRNIGWKKPLLFSYGCLVGLFFILVIVGIAWISGSIRVNKITFNNSKWLYLFIVFTLVAISEELLYRGTIARLLTYKFITFWAVIISSLIFTTDHFFNPYSKPDMIGAINLFIGGCFLTLLYLWTKSLWLPIGFHLTWNWTQEAVLEWFSSESIWVKNSFFGLEGWPITVVFWIVVMSIFLWLLKRQGEIGGCPPWQPSNQGRPHSQKTV